MEKIPGSGSGSGRVGVLKYTIGYFRVSFLLSGISGYSWVFLGILDIISFFLEVVTKTLLVKPGEHTYQAWVTQKKLEAKNIKEFFHFSIEIDNRQ